MSANQNKKEDWIKHDESSMSKFFRARFLKADGSLKSGRISSSIWPGIKKVWNFVASNKQWTVLDFIQNARWNFPQVVSGFRTEILEQVRSIHISGMEDVCLWCPSSVGVFTIKSAWEVSRRRSAMLGWSFLVCQSAIQPRQAVFGWRWIRNKLAVDENLKRRGIPLLSRCDLCGKAKESKTHLFYECRFAVSLWNLFCQCFGVLWPNFVGDVQLISWWKLQAKSVSFKVVWNKGFVLIPVFIWMERNSRRYEVVYVSEHFCFARIKNEIHSQTQAHSGVAVSTEDLVCARRFGFRLLTTEIGRA
ncbi:uncharacterized protein LOC122074308 [Macadamia integrifolia]|uniref:uncharacterized protein LOC122074308 n=1 Tax=Macadamia integrifolia TaxID=60698 RepID=UPI001C4FB830|nr:uncharacterized protein LOC122074308 [Macadamia integrifolia]